MIYRTIKESIIKAIHTKPVVLVTGARQVGKSTLCAEIGKEHGYNYVSLDNLRERETAINDPELFLTLHKAPLIIDEIQYAPKLFDVIEAIVNERKINGGDNKGMYILTGSESYSLMQGVTQSLAGRVSIIEMSPFSLREIRNLEERPFIVEPNENDERNKENCLDIDELYPLIIKGFFPELYDNPLLDAETFYSDYVKTYLERDVSKLINLKDKMKFQKFMEVLASLTGEEFIANNLAKAIGVSVLTIQSWISILLAGNIIFLLEPYNEIIKSYKNNNKKPNFYYYRDIDQREIDLVILENGVLSFVECKSGISYGKNDIRAFAVLKNNTRYAVGKSAIVCATNEVYSVDIDVYVIPFGAI